MLAVIKATLKITFAIYIVFGSSWGKLIKVTFSHFVRELVIVDPFRAGGVKYVAEDLSEVEIEVGAGTGLQLCGKIVSEANSNAGAEFFLEADAEVVSEAFSKVGAELGAEADVEDVSDDFAGDETVSIAVQLL